MPDDSHKTAIPMVMDVATLHQRFGAERDCLDYLKRIRWGSELERFKCPDCGHAKGWWLARRRLVECQYCCKQTSVTAGTVFHRVRTPLWKWFWAIYQLAQDKKGIAALELAKQVGVCYGTAWLMLHKLRRAMRDRTQRDTLNGLVEVDETYLGGRAAGAGRGGTDRKTPVAVAIELDAHRKPKRIAMGVLDKVDRHSLKRFAARTIEKGSKLRTDGWGGFRTLAKAGFEHEPIKRGAKAAPQTFPWLQTFVGNIRRMLTGTYHNVSAKHLDHYLAEFTYRANRRWTEATLFERLIQTAIFGKALTYKELLTGVR